MDLQASGELYLAFKNFQDKYVRKPNEKMTVTRKIHRAFMQEIGSAFQHIGICHHLEDTGISCEGYKVRSSSEDNDFKFDVMMVINKHTFDLQVLADDARPDYAWLKLNRGKKPCPELDKVLKYWNFFGRIFAGDLYVDPGQTIDIFFDELQKLIFGSAQMSGKVKLSRHGLAIRMDVYPDSGVVLWGPRLYSVDLVPAYQVGGGLYVSKPLKEEVPTRMTWRRSFSIYEKHFLSGGAKCVLRALKVVRNRETGLAPLTSYHLKTALYYEKDDEYDWSDRVLVLRFLGVLRRLEWSLANETLPHFFIREINILATMSSSSMRNMRDAIKFIRENEQELMTILN